MNKLKLADIISFSIFLSATLLMGVGCIPSTKPIKSEIISIQPDPNYFPIPSTTTPTVASICSEYTESQKTRIFSQAFQTTLSKVFSEPDADFTFEYPSYWTYGENRCGRIEDSNSRTWNFQHENENVLSASFRPYEQAFDSCNEVLNKKTLDESSDRFPPDYFYKFNVYPTNDPKTTVLVQTCGLAAYITFETGYHPQTVEEVYRTPYHKTNPKKFHIIALNFYGNSSKPPQQFLGWVERIGKSIKIKK